jgi:hypothetical protein
MSGANAISSPLASVTAIASNDVWAVGSAGLNTISSLIEHWDGAQWSIVSSPVPGGQGFEFTGVSGSASNDVWVVGSYFGTPFALKPLIEHWNGSTWTIVPSYPAPDGAEIMSVVATGVSDAWATGYKSDLNDVVTLLVYRWNGATWTQQPGLALGIGNFLVGFGVSAVAVSPDGTTLVASTNQDAGTLAMLLGRRLR